MLSQSTSRNHKHKNKIIYGPFVAYHMNCWLNLIIFLISGIRKCRNKFSIILKKYFCRYFPFNSQAIPDHAYEFKKNIYNLQVYELFQKMSKCNNINLLFCVCESCFISAIVHNIILWCYITDYFNKAKKVTFPGAAALDTGVAIGMETQVNINKAGVNVDGSNVTDVNFSRFGNS